MTVALSIAPAPSSSLPEDYLERVYAGVLGKLIGVYLGRPIEGWTYERISREIGEVQYYLHQQLGVPLVVTDDDITGTFTFLRALEQQPDASISAREIGEGWLNSIIRGKTILWWGGRGMCTEHTAYLNLERGIEAPRSGSIEQNGEVVAEQIGAQIFIDGWAMVAPGDPALAAHLATEAGRVSHDGEAVLAACALAAMEAQAFVTSSIPALLDTALSVIPEQSVIARLICELRELHGRESDWRVARAFVETHYGYDRYPGNCHVVPNHALIIMALLYGNGDFQRSMMIVNTSGWDTDCNAGNLGCLLGIMNGLEGLEVGPDWRTPIADRLYLPTAEGGRAITDAAREALWVANLGRALHRQSPIVFKDGARFHFELPGSVQGFQVGTEPDTLGTTTLRNVPGHSELGQRTLELRCEGLAPGRSGRAMTATFSPREALAYNPVSQYEMLGSPTLYPGQVVSAWVTAEAKNTGPLQVSLVLESSDAADQPLRLLGSGARLDPGQRIQLNWRVPEVGGAPIAAIGLQVDAAFAHRTSGAVYFDALDWTGMPTLRLTRPETGTLWRQAWVNAVDIVDERWNEAFRLIQNQGRGLYSQGTREWTDYAVQATLTPALSVASGLAVRVQGMRRYYALLLVRGALRLVKSQGHEQVLAEVPLDWSFDQPYQLRLEAGGPRLRGWLNGELRLDVLDEQAPLIGGAAGLVIEEGMLTCELVEVSAVHPH